MVVPPIRYSCTCLAGSHLTPTCPPRLLAEIHATNAYSRDLEYRTRMYRQQMARQGLLPPDPVDPWWTPRLWWLPVGLIGWLVLMIIL